MVPKPFPAERSDFTDEKEAVKPLVGHGQQSERAALRLFMLQGCHRFISLSLCIVKKKIINK